jgi:hypothetical protein
MTNTGHNGVGPWWFPSWARRLLTWLSGLFFDEASWVKHDEGYAAGNPSRCECDRKFLQAMLRDASETGTTLRVFACLGLSVFFWIMVRLFGWLSYGRR